MSMMPPSPSRGALQGAFGQAQQQMSAAPPGAPPGGGDPADAGAIADHEQRISALEASVHELLSIIHSSASQGAAANTVAQDQGGPPVGP